MSRITSVPNANRHYYAQVADRYDMTEGCVVDPRLRERLRETLSFALNRLPAGTDLRVLDACGGSGIASLMLLQMGLTPLSVDLSPDMLAISDRNARAAGHRPSIEVDETHDLTMFLGRLKHRISGVFHGPPHPIENLGALAERHALTGVDDVGLVHLAGQRGWRVLRHARFFGARFFLTTRLPFSLVLRAPGDWSSNAAAP